MSVFRSFFRRPSYKKYQRPNGNIWSAHRLEAREMLAADTAVAVETSASETSVVEFSEVFELREGQTQDATIQSGKHQVTASALVLIDSRVEDIDTLLDGISSSSEVILIDANQDGLSQISEALAHRTGIASIHLIAHGASGELQLGRTPITSTLLRQHADAIGLWRNSLTESADILLYGCDTGSGYAGREFIELLANLSGADVAASTDKTGAAKENGDWDLEQAIGPIESSLVIAPATQEKYQHTLAISIRAAGATGEENMSLQIDGVTVQSWTNIGGEFDEREFETFTYEADTTDITADRVRVVFSNDLFIDGSLDRNLRVDSITLNDQTIESEDPSVFSTGTWTTGRGVKPGFWSSEQLHSNGYFQYGTPPGNGSLITINAAGQTGDESMSLLIDGIVVQSWDNIGGNPNQGQFETFVFKSDSIVNASQIRVAFTNDLFDQAAGYDRNLVVNKISIDGTNMKPKTHRCFPREAGTRKLKR